MKKLIPWIFALLPGLVMAGTLERSDNLQQIGQVALERNKPVVLFFNSGYCLPCEKLKERALGAIIRFDQFPEGTQFIEIFIDRKTPIKDFYGENIGMEDFALFYNVTELPTLVFVDGEGNQIARPIVNNGAYEFFSHVLNSHLDDALKTLNNK
jgi:thioredoxin-related protein